MWPPSPQVWLPLLVDWHAASTIPSSCNVSAGLFAGAALWVSAVEHPAGMETDVKAFYKFFPNMYKR
jgi:hypothetical protein